MVAFLKKALLTAALALAIGGASVGCAGGPRVQPRAQVRFLVEPDTARIYTDERFVGSARVLAVRPAEFRAGPRRFSITAEGYFPHDVEVDLAPGTTTIELRLRPIPP